MNPELEPSPASSQPIPPDSKISLILRVGFYIGAVLAGMMLFPGLLLVFGPSVAGIFGLFAAGLVANLLTMRIFDRRPLTDIGMNGTAGSGRNFGLGFLLGGGSGAVMLIAPLLAGSGHLIPRIPQTAFHWPNLLFYMVLLLFGAVGEEMIFHGYGFQLLVEKMGPFATVLPVSVVFGVGHAGNPSANLLGLMNTALWGALLGYSFLRSRDLWLPIGLHYGWNAVLPLFGVNLSGLTIEVTGYSYQWDLTPLWSGGNYGPEGGLLTTIFVVVLFFLLSRAPVVPQTAAIATRLNESVQAP